MRPFKGWRRRKWSSVRPNNDSLASFAFFSPCRSLERERAAIKYKVEVVTRSSGSHVLALTDAAVEGDAPNALVQVCSTCDNSLLAP